MSRRVVYEPRPGEVDADFPPREQALVHEIESPFFVEFRRRRRRVPADRSDASLLSGPNLQALLAINAAQTLVIHDDLLALEQNLEPSPTESWSLLHQASQPVAYELVVGGLAALVPHGCSRASRDDARLPFAEPLVFEGLHRFFAR